MHSRIPDMWRGLCAATAAAIAPTAATIAATIAPTATAVPINTTPAVTTFDTPAVTTTDTTAATTSRVTAAATPLIVQEPLPEQSPLATTATITAALGELPGAIQIPGCPVRKLPPASRLSAEACDGLRKFILEKDEQWTRGDPPLTTHHSPLTTHHSTHPSPLHPPYSEKKDKGITDEYVKGKPYAIDGDKNRKAVPLSTALVRSREVRHIHGELRRHGELAGRTPADHAGCSPTPALAHSPAHAHTHKSPQPAHTHTPTHTSTHAQVWCGTSVPSYRMNMQIFHLAPMFTESPRQFLLSSKLEMRCAHSTSFSFILPPPFAHHTTPYHTTPHHTTPHHTTPHHTTSQLDFQVTDANGNTVILTLLPGHPDPRVPAWAETTIGVGDILIFDGDVIHRGCSYQSTCVAMHIYLDVPEVQRVPPNVDGSFWKTT